jgi:DNA-binding NtrC family response regulator
VRSEAKEASSVESVRIAPGSVRRGPLPEGENRNVVVVNPSKSDLKFFTAVCEADGWTLHTVRTYRDAMTELCLNRAPVIVCNVKLPDGTWEDVLSGACNQTPGPRVIVLSPQVDERLWGEVLNMGGFDVLSAPLSLEEVRHVLGSAWKNWRDESHRENWRRVGLAAAAG